MSDELLSLEGFAGLARLFPLPNLVLFPHVIQPLHIFEPRYRQLLADALEDDRLMAMALLQPGWEKDYHKRPAIHPVVCLGRIFKEEKLADGRCNLLLHGVSRARIRKEEKTDKLYRLARVQLLPDVPISKPEREQELRHQLDAVLRQRFNDEPHAQEHLLQLLTTQANLGVLSDILAFALPLEPEVKQRLLEEPDCEHRVLQLLDLLAPDPKSGEPGERPWPPEFSAN